jgi:hypothetical protein
MIGFSFHEIMEGSIERVGERFDRPFRFEVDVSTPNMVARVAMCSAEGFTSLDGLAKHAATTGRLELSPFVEHRIRYVLDFTGDDGKRYRFDGSKSIPLALSLRRYMRSWTTLPGEVTMPDEGNALYGRASLRFHLKRHLRGLVSSARFSSAPALGPAHAH